MYSRAHAPEFAYGKAYTPLKLDVWKLDEISFISLFLFFLHALYFSWLEYGA